MAKKKDLKGATASLFQILEEREKELQKWEEDLTRRESLLAVSSNGAKPEDILHLNVGGRTGITVHRSTLTLIENSLLGAQFSKNWENGVNKDENGNIFIDQDPDLFMTLVNFLRSRRNDVQHLGVCSPRISEEFDLLLHYYDAMLGVYPVEIKQVNGAPSDATITNYPNFSISSTEFCSFDLTSFRHSRRIQSFKVVVGDFSKLLIGWRDTNDTASNVIVGMGNSMAIDVGKRVCLFKGKENAQDALEHITTGVTIRCEADARETSRDKQFHWSLMGEDVDMEHKYYIYDPTNVLSLSDACIPCISIKGKVELSKSNTSKSVIRLRSASSSRQTSNLCPTISSIDWIRITKPVLILYLPGET